MKRQIWFVALIIVIVLAALAPATAMAADPAGRPRRGRVAPGRVAPAQTRIWLVHGISGLDMGSAYMQYPLDFKVDGVGCYPNMMFTRTFGPIKLQQPGTYAVSISAANPGAPCSSAPIAVVPVTLQRGEGFTVVAHLDAAGVRRLTPYWMELGRTTNLNGKSRFNAANTALIGPVDLIIRPQGRRDLVAANDLYNPGMINFNARSGQWKWWFTDSAGTTTLLGPMVLNTKTHFAYFFFLVGSQANGLYTASFSVNTKP